MAYQLAATAVTLNDHEGHSQVVGLFKCNPSNICAALYTTRTPLVDGAKYITENADISAVLPKII